VRHRSASRASLLRAASASANKIDTRAWEAKRRQITGEGRQRRPEQWLSYQSSGPITSAAVKLARRPWASRRAVSLPRRAVRIASWYSRSSGPDGPVACEASLKLLAAGLPAWLFARAGTAAANADGAAAVFRAAATRVAGACARACARGDADEEEARRALVPPGAAASRAAAPRETSTATASGRRGEFGGGGAASKASTSITYSHNRQMREKKNEARWFSLTF
jgi:hypothetical protein